MNINFAYDPRKEVDTLKVGFSSQNSQTPTDFAEEARRTGIDFTNSEQVAAFATGKIEREGIDTMAITQDFSKRWKQVEQEASSRFRKIFKTDWDTGNVTAYLTLSTRCPYNFKERYYFVSIGGERKTPVQTSLHELIHFYTHELIEPLFTEAGIRSKHNEFKEALSVLLNIEFTDLLEHEDKGYEQHHALRQSISDDWKAGKDVYAITRKYIEKQSTP